MTKISAVRNHPTVTRRNDRPGLNRRSLRLTRIFAAGVALMLLGSLAACGTDRRVYEEAVASAESGLAISLEITARELADLLSERAEVSDISADDIVNVFLTDARNYEAGPGEPVITRAVFDIVENADGSVTFSVYFKDSVYRGAVGLSTISVGRHTCGTLTGRFTERALSIGDLDCPQELAAYAGDESVYMPMAENAEKHDVEIDTSP